MNCREIVKEWLQANGYDGLINIWQECSCKLDDLMPCDFDCVPDCEPHAAPPVGEEMNNILDSND